MKAVVFLKKFKARFQTFRFLKALMLLCEPCESQAGENITSSKNSALSTEAKSQTQHRQVA